MTNDPSRWWNALLPFPILVALRYVVVWLTTQLLPTAGPTRSEALPVLFLGLGGSLIGALVVATAPVFAVGLALDVRALRNHSSWTPHWGYGILGVVPVLGIFIESFALVSIPVAGGYLAIRRRRIGYPLEREPMAERDPKIATNRSRLHEPASRWFYGVVIPPLLEMAGWLVLWLVGTTGILREGSDPLTLLVPVALVLTAVGLVPLFAVSLYLDARAVNDAQGGPIVKPVVWGLVGLGSLVALVLFRAPFTPIIAIAYLVRRHLGQPSPAGP